LTLDAASITTDAIPLGGPGATGFALDPNQKIPVLVSQSGNTSVYRFWTVGSYAAGDVQVSFVAGKVRFNETTTPSSFTGPVSPVNFTVDGVATPNLHYLDVQLTPTSGDVILTTPMAPELRCAGVTCATPVAANAAPLLLTGTSVYRYFFKGDFAPGLTEVRFPDGFVTSGPAAAVSPILSIESSSHFAVQQLTAHLADPTGGSTSSLGAINNRGFVDVTFGLPSYAQGVDAASVIDGAPQFTIKAQSSSDGTMALDTTQKPVLVDAATNKFRFFTTGTAHGKPVDLTFVGGTFSYLDAGGKSISFFGPEQLKVGKDANGAYVDVFFCESAALDASTVGSDAISVKDATNTALAVGMVESTNPAPGVFRFRLSSTSLSAGQPVTVTFDQTKF